MMALLRLSRYEAEEGMLPPICVRCGAPATRYKGVGFSTLSDWFYLIVLFILWPLAVLASILRQRVRFLLPVCDAHRNHWRWRRAWLACCFVLVLIYLGMLFDAASSIQIERTFAVRALVWIVGPIWLLVVLLARMKMVRPNQVTEEGVRLIGVHPKFARAYRAEHTAPERPSAPVPIAPSLKANGGV